MKAIRIIAFCAIAAALCSCSKSGTAPGKGGQVRFSASVGSFAFTRATESALEDGDRVRVIAGSPINASSVGTVSGTALTLDSPIYWNEGQSESTTFAAVFQKDGVADALTSISYDLLYEGSHAYEYHNLFMTATRTAAPGHAVALEFRHPFSKITVSVTNNLAGDAVSKVEIKEIVMEGTLNLTEGTVALGGSKAGFEAAKLSEGSYAAVVMPQTASPTITVTVASGTSYTFVLAGAFTFAPGYAYNAALTLNPSTTPSHGEAASFSFTVTPWQDGGELGYTLSDSYTPSWGVVGTVNGSDWGEDFPMTQTATGDEPYKGTWEADITYSPGNAFKLRWNKDWEIQAGMPTTEGYEFVPLGVSGLWGSNNADIVIGTAESGSYHLKFVYDGYWLTVTKN